jgi:hypothetical protein
MTDTKPAKAEVHGHRITWFCRVCDQPIGPYTGYLAIDIYAVNEVERDARNRESAEPRAYTAGEFLDFPHHPYGGRRCTRAAIPTPTAMNTPSTLIGLAPSLG